MKFELSHILNTILGHHKMGYFDHFFIEIQQF